MGRYRKIEVRMWGDEKFRALSPVPACGQGLWFFLLTGPHTLSIPGLSTVGRAAMAEQLKWSEEAFDKAFGEALAQGMVKADWEARVVWVPNGIKHNKPESPNVVLSWGDQFDLIPECALKREAYEAIKTSVYALGEAYEKAFDKAFKKPSGKTLPKPMPNQEQEQEQEQEKNPSSEPSGSDQSASDEDSPTAKVDQGLEAVWAYYMTEIGRNPKQYSWSPPRNKMGAARLRDLRKRCSGSLEDAVELMKLCIDRLKTSPHHNGANPQGTKYIDWENLFRTTEKMEFWLNDDRWNKATGAADGK
jgi:hypothetical protein